MLVRWWVLMKHCCALSRFLSQKRRNQQLDMQKNEIRVQVQTPPPSMKVGSILLESRACVFYLHSALITHVHDINLHSDICLPLLVISLASLPHTHSLTFSLCHSHNYVSFKDNSLSLESFMMLSQAWNFEVSHLISLLVTSVEFFCFIPLWIVFSCTIVGDPSLCLPLWSYAFESVILKEFTTVPELKRTKGLFDISNINNKKEWSKQHMLCSIFLERGM